MTGKNELRQNAAALLDEASNLSAELDDEWQSHHEQWEEVNRLQEEADELADEFKQLYEEAREAYDNDEKGLAKELSTEGKEKQEECEELNAEANELRAELHKERQYLEEKSAQIDRLRNKAQLLIDRSRKSRRKRDYPKRRLELSNWNECKELSEKDLLSFLKSEIPSEHSKPIRSIGYKQPYSMQRNSHFRAGNISENCEITIFEPPQTSRNKKSLILMSLCHEVGHSVYRGLNSELKDEWKQLLLADPVLQHETHERYPDFSANRIRSEAFATCYARYIRDPLLRLEHYDVYVYFQDRVFSGREYP